MARGDRGRGVDGAPAAGSSVAPSTYAAIYISRRPGVLDEIAPSRRGIAIVQAPFEAKDLIKRLAFRRWESRRRAWIIPLDDVRELEALADADGYRVVHLD